MSDPTIATLLAGALDAYAELEALGEDVEDEWTYVTDLEAAWRERLEAAIAERGDEAATPEMEAAIDRAADEIGRIRDPHRAIDWLSTYPQVVLLAIGERP
jgi:alkylhydroperoxidase family enzyme